MRGALIGLAIGVLVLVGGFFTLVFLADALAPEPREIRIEVSDELGV